VTSQQSAPVAYDPYALEVRADPYPSYRLLRDHAPAYYVADHNFWCISRFDDVARAVTDTDAFSSADGIGVERAPALPELDLPPSVNAAASSMIAMDPPQHTRLRRIVTRQFTRARIAEFENRIKVLANELVDTLIARNLDGEADIARDLATPLPTMIILDILDIPRDDREQFKQWSDQSVHLIGGGIDPALQMSAVDAALELGRYFESLASRRRVAPGDDLVSVLCKASDGEQLTEAEVIGQCVLFLVGGNETTTNLIGNTVNALMAHPEQRHQLENSPGLVPAAIEEVLRWDAPVQGLFRTTRCDVNIDGTVIPAGARVQLLYGSANRDERHYPDPDLFQIARNPRDHLAFARGAHFCIGAPLARLEAKAAVESLLARTRDMRPTTAPVLNLNVLVRGFRNLPVSFAEAS
jgi:cytochrome P450